MYQVNPQNAFAAGIAFVAIMTLFVEKQVGALRWAWY
jgi:hypothetical protein